MDSTPSNLCNLQPSKREAEVIDWSIVLPSRDRVSLIAKLCQSIRDTASDISRIEVLVAIDEDDRTSMRAVPGLEDSFPFVRFYAGKHQKNFSSGYYNPLAEMSRGRFVQLMNDDVEFLTPKWDRLALETLDQYTETRPDKICLGEPNDDTGAVDCGKPYACFPVLSREAINAMGYAQNPGYTTWGADTHLARVFRSLDRAVSLPFALKHTCPQNKTRRRDGHYSRLRGLARYPWVEVVLDTGRIQAMLAHSG